MPAVTTWPREATWSSCEEALVADVDVLVPCAVGGILTAQLAGDIRAEVIVGAANNQLDGDNTADVLHEHNILWCPDVVVSAGGIIGSVGRKRDGLSAVVGRANHVAGGVGSAATGGLATAGTGAPDTPATVTVAWRTRIELPRP